jgi:DNA-binding response OmpR family regulator
MALQPSRTLARSVLLVDDDQDTLQLYSEFLRLSGFCVWTAPTTPAALLSAREHHPDVVVTDITLPGQDGWALCRLLRADATTRDCGLIALTGWVHDAQLSLRAREAGVDLVLTKPCLPDSLLTEIESVRRRVQLLKVRGQDGMARVASLPSRSDRLAEKARAIHSKLHHRH